MQLDHAYRRSVEGREDGLEGLKENVIIGKLIPAGTGMPVYREIATEAPDYKPMPYYSSDTEGLLEYLTTAHEEQAAPDLSWMHSSAPQEQEVAVPVIVPVIESAIEEVVEEVIEAPEEEEVVVVEAVEEKVAPDPVAALSDIEAAVAAREGGATPEVLEVLETKVLETLEILDTDEPGESAAGA